MLCCHRLSVAPFACGRTVEAEGGRSLCGTGQTKPNFRSGGVSGPSNGRAKGQDVTPCRPSSFSRLEPQFSAEGDAIMAHAIRFYKTGGPEVLVREEVEVGRPSLGEARVRYRAASTTLTPMFGPACIQHLFRAVF
jgi:hypothetical protein